MTEALGRGAVVGICGKGGVGKTTLAALMAAELAAARTRALLVDADHAGGLAMALGVEPARTLCDVRVEAMDEAAGRGVSRADLSRSLDYQLQEALHEQGSLALLAMGRPRDRGCYCAVNRLLREAVSRLAAGFDVTLVDAEAGLEQLSRDVLAVVGFLLLVSDGSAKGLRVAETALEVARATGREPAAGLVLARTRSEGEVEAAAARTSLPVLGSVPEDDLVRRFDAEERSFLEMPDGPARRAVRGLMAELGLARA